ncbi:uncharacterized protein LOC134331832 [Trichomycterus rosablanca]|uniref:uncharacterized protein LOC134331832 n=1 Tax=Trichomycterus rosablanca TaxID=2290929 RepID=UPI002F35AB4F
MSVPASGTQSSTSHPPDVSCSSTPEDQSSCLLESNFEGSSPDDSVEDLSDLKSLRDSEYFRDLQDRRADDTESSEHLPSVIVHPEENVQPDPGLLPHPAPERGTFRWNLCPPHADMNLLCDPEMEMSVDELDMDSFPILVRSMSTSRRHSWDAPLFPLDLGRRLSLDTRSIDSDVERDEQNQFHSLVENFTTSELIESSALTPDRLDEKSRAEKVSRILETSKQAAGEEHDSDEALCSAEGRSHVSKRRGSNAGRKDLGNVTWYEFLSNENEDEEEDRVERTEKGTKVKRTLSSLRNRMTGSFNKDKGKNREREREKEREKEREHERELKGGTRMVSSRCNGHQLVRGSFSSRATCSLCSKSLQRKHGLQCVSEYCSNTHSPTCLRPQSTLHAALVTDCAVNVHKTCKTFLPECSNNKNKTKDFAQRIQAAHQIYNQDTVTLATLDELG